LTKEKGIETVLKALLEVRGHFPGMLTVCGRGEPEYERALHRFVTQHSLPVQFIQTSAAQMQEIYKQHDALVFSSEWEEPFALTPLEAMSCGLPVISTTTGGSAELFHDGVNALTYEAGSAQELARQILKLHGYPELRERIATTGYDQVREHFSEAKIMDAIEQYVRKAVDEWPLEQNKQPSRIDFKTAKTPGGSELTYA
jgi:glycosyltransferase involved in cell wall biosynthesis